MFAHRLDANKELANLIIKRKFARFDTFTTVDNLFSLMFDNALCAGQIIDKWMCIEEPKLITWQRSQRSLKSFPRLDSRWTLAGVFISSFLLLRCSTPHSIRRVGFFVPHRFDQLFCQKTY
jgi:hypothetical protein